MAEVLLTLKVMPEDAGTDLEALGERLKEVSTGRYNSIEREPIGFGIIALKVSYVIPEEEGVSEKLEEEIGGMEGVGEVESLESHRLI